MTIQRASELYMELNNEVRAAWGAKKHAECLALMRAREEISKLILGVDRGMWEVLNQRRFRTDAQSVGGAA